MTLSANVGSGYTLGEALDHLETVAREVMPAETQFDYTGISRDFKASGAGVALTFALALVFIYLVLAAQFESFVDPLVILFSVPLSMAGALLALELFGGTLNIYSQVGMVTLIGLITKHGILIVEFANQQLREGRGLDESVMEAAVQRLRPILMTTGAMVLGSLPLAIATGAGAESRRQIGMVIVGGCWWARSSRCSWCPRCTASCASGGRSGRWRSGRRGGAGGLIRPARAPAG